MNFQKEAGPARPGDLLKVTKSPDLPFSLCQTTSSQSVPKCPIVQVRTLSPARWRAAGRSPLDTQQLRSEGNWNFPGPPCRSSDPGQPVTPHRAPGSHSEAASRGSQEGRGRLEAGALGLPVGQWAIRKQGPLSPDSRALSFSILVPGRRIGRAGQTAKCLCPHASYPQQWEACGEGQKN